MVGKAHHGPQHVLDDDDGHALIPDGPDKLDGLFHLRGVQSGDDLVEQQHIGLGGQGPGHLHALELGQGQGVAGGVCHIGKAHPLQHGIGRVPGLGRFGVADIGPHHHVLQHGEVAEGLADLIGPADAHLAHLVRLGVVDELAVIVELALGHGQGAGEHVEQGGLAGAVGADEAQDLIFMEDDVHVVHCHQAAEALGYVPALQNDVLAVVLTHGCHLTVFPRRPPCAPWRCASSPGRP